MKTQDSLYNLVHSLSKAEKRQFKILTDKGAGKKHNFIFLFEALDGQKIYDEKKLKQKLKAYPFFNHLNKVKFHLYDLILKALRPLKSANSVQSEIEGMLQSVDFLYTKGLYLQAYKYLQKTKKYCLKFHLTPLLFRVLDWEKKLISYLPSKMTSLKVVQQQFAEYEKLASHLRMEIRYGLSIEKIELLSVLKNDSHVQQLLREEAENLFYSTPKEAPTFLSKVYFLEFLALSATYSSDPKNAMDCLTRIQQLWAAEPQLIKVYNDIYQRTTTNFILSQINASSVDLSIDELLKDFKSKVKIGSPEEELKIELISTILDFISNLSKANIEICTSRLWAIRSQLPQIERLLSIHWQVMLQFHISIYYFLKKDYEESLLYVQQVQQLSKYQFFSNRLRFCRLIELIVHYERGNFQFLESEIRKQCKALKENSAFEKIESLILDTVRQLLNAPGHIETDDIFIRLSQALKETIEVRPAQADSLQANLLFHWINTNLYEIGSIGKFN